MENPEAYQREVAAAVMQAIVEASIVEEAGTPAAYVVSTEAVAALITMMASILESAPGCETMRAMRELTEGIGRKILAQMKEMRKINETTDHRAFETIYTQSN